MNSVLGTIFAIKYGDFVTNLIAKNNNTTQRTKINVATKISILH